VKLSPSEHEIVGSWSVENGNICADEACQRIKWLTESYLRKVATSQLCGNWETLYQDPDDGRYWECNYPQGEMQGGGPPCLKFVSRDEASAKYQLS
jgi:hypothetical protein